MKPAAASLLKWEDIKTAPTTWNARFCVTAPDQPVINAFRGADGKIYDEQNRLVITGATYWASPYDEHQEE